MFQELNLGTYYIRLQVAWKHAEIMKKGTLLVHHKEANTVSIEEVATHCTYSNK